MCRRKITHVRRNEAVLMDKLFFKINSLELIFQYYSILIYKNHKKYSAESNPKNVGFSS
jgi:hypothetical protein